jgi:hypothetical protein
VPSVQIDLRFASPSQGNLEVVVAPVLRFADIGFNAGERSPALHLHLQHDAALKSHRVLARACPTATLCGKQSLTWAVCPAWPACLLQMCASSS